MQMLSPKEEQLMYAIWTVGHPCLISEMLHADPTLNRNTVVQSLKTLQRKNYLKVDSIKKSTTRTGKAYAAIISKEDYDSQKHLIRTIEETSDIKKGFLSLFSALMDIRQLDDKTLTQMEEIIQNYQKNI